MMLSNTSLPPPPSNSALLWARSVGKEVVQDSRCWCPSYVDMCHQRLCCFYCIVSRTPRDADSDLIARSHFELPCLFVRPPLVCISSTFIEFPDHVGTFTIWTGALLLKGPVLSFQLLGVLYEVADERFYVESTSALSSLYLWPIISV